MYQYAAKPKRSLTVGTDYLLILFLTIYISHRYNLSRKEKYSSEDTSNVKEVTVPNTTLCHQFDALEMLHKMRWLRNQNDKNYLERYYLYFYLMQNFCFV